MSSDKTKRLRLNKWVGSDQVLRAEFNENFDKIDTYVDDSLAVKTTSVQLKQGLQVIDVNQSSPLNNVTIQGRTLVNLLGRAGLPGRTPTKWKGVSATVGVSTEAAKYIDKSLKVSHVGTINFAVATANPESYPCDPTKHYLALAEVHNKDVDKGVQLIVFKPSDGGAMVGGTSALPGSGGFQLLYCKVKPSDFGSEKGFGIMLHGNGPTIAGKSFHTDGIRVYEITQAEYNGLDSMTLEQIAVKWPYVDDMKSVYSPYIIKYGGNLLPDVCTWWPQGGLTNYEFKGTNKATITTDTTLRWLQVAYIPVPLNTTLTFSASHNGWLSVYGNDDAALIGTWTQAQNYTFNTGKNNTINLAFSNLTGTAGTFTIENPMLNFGEISKPFKSRNDKDLYFPNVELASNVDGTIYDTLFQRDGKYWKQTRFKTMDLTGDLGWEPGDGKSGFKYVFIKGMGPSTSTYLSSTVTKYDGKILTFGDVSQNADVQNISLSGSFYVSISNADSGWGESYKDLSTEEIQAYFYGWRMYVDDGTGNFAPYNGVGVRAWGYRTADGGYGGLTSTLPRTPAPGFIPYKLQYELAKPAVEEIASEGGITLHEGPNLISVGTAMIVREKANQKTFKNYYAIINSNDLAYPIGSALKHRPEKILKVYCNERKDGKWNIDNSIDAIGKQRAWIFYSNYDPLATYTVTYLALDKYALTCNVQSIQAEFASNIKSVVDTLAVGQSDMAARIGALEITRAQRAQPQWIKPTLLNGWTNFDLNDASAGYCLDEFSIVRLQGLIKPGVTAQGTVILQLPASCRPSHIRRFTVPALGDGVFSFADLFVNSRGELRIDAVPKGVTWVSLDTITFNLF
ncbi:hypothetical protein ACJ7K1_27250 [Paenibacillus elgii]